MKNILITGSSSMLGKHTCSILKQDNLITPTHQECDLMDINNLRNINQPIDYVINYCGFNGNIDFSRKYPADIFYQTSQMALNVLTFCQERKVKKVINILSSCSLPDKKDKLYASELWNGLPNETIEAHGLAKRTWHAYSKQLYKQYNLQSICVILNNCYGTFDNLDINKTKAVMGIIKKIVDAKKNNTDVYCWGSGNVYREFVYAPDAVHCIIQALETYDNVNVPLNISSQDEISIKELTKLVAKIVDYQGKIIWDTSKPDGQIRKSLDTTQMKKYITHPMTPLQEGLTTTINWYYNLTPEHI